MVAYTSTLTFFALAPALLTLLPSINAFPLAYRTKDVKHAKRAVDPALILDFGHQSGINPTGTGDCDGAIPGGPKIPCSCPPPRDEFIQQLNANVDAGFAVNNPTVQISFPTGPDIPSQITRITAHLITLQNLNGPGRGCPAVSTTLLARQQALQAELDAQRQTSGDPDTTIIATETATVTTTSSSPPPTDIIDPEPTPQAGDVTPPVSVVARLAPDLGFTAGVNPTGTGDCDSAKPGGLPKIPCTCPPARDEFIKQLEANVAAGKALNNPSVPVTFPLDDSNNSKRARIIASLITLQNLEGPGKGCPAVSTTLVEQMGAIPA